MPPHPVLMALEAQRRPSMRPGSSPSIAPSRPSSAPSFDFILEHEPAAVALPSVASVPWAKVVVAALAIPALVAVASWFYYV